MDISVVLAGSPSDATRAYMGVSMAEPNPRVLADQPPAGMPPATGPDASQNLPSTPTL